LLLLLCRWLSPVKATAGGHVTLEGLALELGAAWPAKAVELELVALLIVLAKVLVVEARKSATSSAILVPALLALVLLEWIVAGRAVAGIAAIVSLGRSRLHLALPAAIHLVFFVVIEVPLTLLSRIHQ